ncbi:MAG TPA: glycosyltransferase [Desulfomonilaceae bacterium]|nr:glycosyltransferase [Desulfomonilaceae bacterium]
MTFFQVFLAVWLLSGVIPFAMAIAAGMWRLAQKHPIDPPCQLPITPVDVLIPVKGTFPGQERILASMLQQSYPDYQVIFILESDDDPAAAVVDTLSRKYSHIRKVVGGISVTSAQKNYNLLVGLQHIRSETEILVFCDSTNIAHPNWLERFTAAARSREAEAVTTFRSFKPEPETIGSVCQAIYGTFVLLLAATVPKPWGGATAIRRETFERLRVSELWAKTVVDDLVLGNALQRGGVSLKMDTSNLLTSPLRNQTVQAFLSYLDRQILFPKFTNPGIWLAMLIAYLNFTFAFLVSLGVAGAFACGRAEGLPGICAWVFLAALVVVALVLRRVNPFRISLRNWLLYFIPALFFHAFIVVRSIFRNHIDWHGRRYWPGREGIILRTGFTSGD